jgi:hypothetical protein
MRGRMIEKREGIGDRGSYGRAELYDMKAWKAFAYGTVRGRCIN